MLENLVDIDHIDDLFQAWPEDSMDIDQYLSESSMENPVVSEALNFENSAQKFGANNLL